MADIFSIAFPFRAGPLSFPKAITNEEAIKASIIQILTTTKGERVMRPSLGCNVFSFVFENDSTAFRLMVEREIRMSLTQWEPRIAIDSIIVETDAITEPGQFVITINYTIVNSNTFDTVTLAGG
jgi:phage baseplate assembly protein W